MLAALLSRIGNRAEVGFDGLGRTADGFGLRDVAGIALCVDGVARGQLRRRGLDRLRVQIDDGDLGAEFEPGLP